MNQVKTSKDGKNLVLIGPAFGAELKELGATWHKVKGWLLPKSLKNLERLKEMYSRQDVFLDEELAHWGRSKTGFDYEFQQALALVKQTPRQKPLYPYQEEAAAFLLGSAYAGRKGALLSLSPGLGKTRTTIEAAKLLGATRILVICPMRIAQTVWMYQLEQWDSQASKVLVTRTLPPERATYTITHYENAAKTKAFWDTKWDLVIVDESIMVKNRRALRTKMVKRIAENARHVWLLSGSPTSKYHDDLWAQLNILDSHVFASYWRFANQTCHLEDVQNGRVTVVKRSRTTSNPRQDYRDYLWVVSKQDAQVQLPEIIQEWLEVPMLPEQRRVYDRLKDEFILELETEELPIAYKIAQLQKLGQIASHPANVGLSGKAAKLELLSELVEVGGLEYPGVFWVYYKETAKAIYQRLVELGLSCGLATGGDPKRSDVDLDSFANGNSLDAIVLSIGVGKYGHTLTKAQSIVYYDRTWDGDAMFQSTMRFHRLGLEHKPVITTLHTPDSTDDLIQQILDRKFSSIAHVQNEELINFIGGKHHG